MEPPLVTQLMMPLTAKNGIDRLKGINQPGIGLFLIILGKRKLLLNLKQEKVVSDHT